MKRVAIVGVGALGSHVLLFARNWDVKIRIIDFDSVETKNTKAQFHPIASLRKNKALALQTALYGLFGVLPEGLPRKLTSDNAEQLLGDTDLIIDCTDNIEARRVIQSVIAIPKLHGCLSATGDFARIIWSDHGFTPDAESLAGEATCEDGEQLPFFALAAAHLAQEAQRFLSDGTKRSWQLTPNTVIRLG